MNDTSGSTHPASPATPRRAGRRARVGRRLLLILWGAALLFAVLFGFGTSAADVALVERFRQYTVDWEHSCDFREISVVYSDLGSAAIRARFWGISAGDVVMFLRTNPLLPPHLRANPGSAGHYRDFEQGPLVAYLHMVEEMDLQHILPWFEDLGRESDLSDERMKQVIAGFDYSPRKVTQNTDAARSVARMIREVDTASGFELREKPTARIRAAIPALASRLGVPADINAMTVEQQARVYAELDEHLRLYDHQAWRTKQLTDLAIGIWGQAFGPQYLLILDPMLTARRIGRLATPILLAVGLIVFVRSRRGSAGGASNVP